MLLLIALKLVGGITILDSSYLHLHKFRDAVVGVSVGPLGVATYSTLLHKNISDNLGNM